MRIHSIDSNVTTTVTLGKQGYAQSITVTSSGSVAPRAAGDDAVIVPAGLNHAHIVNQGVVSGAIGHGGNTGGAGGVGIDLASAGFVVNQAAIAGGRGGYGYDHGGTGGAGVVFDTSGQLSNSGAISGGGAYAAEYYGTGGSGGLGVQLGAGVHAVNSGSIHGGDGAGCYNQEGGPIGYGGSGGVGVVLTGAAVLTNSGAIGGGAGGYYAPFGGDGFYYGAGGAAGAGIAAKKGGTIHNTGTITGGGGGGGFYRGGQAGDGVDLTAGGTVVNSGLITAGAGGDATYANSQAGGIGVDLVAGGMLTNTGTIAGGVGGYSVFGHGGAGGTGVYISGGTVVTSGTIAGGAGGPGGYGAGATGDAVQFGSVAGTLVVDPGAVFDGKIVGNAAVADTLVLAGHASGTLAGFGSAITGLNDIVADAGAHWRLDGDVSGAGSLVLEQGARVTLGGAVGMSSIVFAGSDAALHVDTSGAIGSVFSGFGAGDIIDLAVVQAASLSFSGGTLSLFDAGGSVVDTLAFSGNYTASDFALKAYGAGTDILFAGTEAHAAGTLPVSWHAGFAR